MKKKRIYANIWITSIIVAVTMIIATYNSLFDFNPRLNLYCTALPIVGAFLMFKTFDKKQKNNLLFIGAALVGLWIWCVFLAAIHDEKKITKFPVLLALVYTGMVTFLLCNSRLPTLPMKIALYLILAFFYYQYFILGITTYGVNEAESGAVNTRILLTVAITIQLLDYRDNQRIALLPSVLIIPISIMSWNRTGFLCSILYMMTVFFLGSSQTRKRSVRYALYVLLAIGVVFAVVRFYDWFASTAIYSKLGNSGVDNSSRSSIWASYFDSFDVVQFLFGRGIDDRHPLAGGFVNAHNSFLMLHAQTGFFALILIGAMIKRLWLYYKHNKFIFLLFMVLIIRCFFDMIFFFHTFDYAYYLFIFNFGSLIIKQSKVSIKIV